MSEPPRLKRSEREFIKRSAAKRENIDQGWRAMLADPFGRSALWELYSACMEQRDVVARADGDASVPMTFRALGKHAMGNWLANRCMLADHQNWLVLLAENERPLDDGRKNDASLEREALGERREEDDEGEE